MPEKFGMSDNRVIVVGGVNVDIGGIPDEPLILHDSCPGRISVSAGGVGRNIAHNLRLLGVNVSIITAFGTDAFTPFLRSSFENLKIDCSMSVFCKDKPSSVYLYIADETGDMHAAVNDMDVVSEITPEHIEKHLKTIDMFDAAVLDANLSEDTLRYISEKLSVPIYADPVSTAKAEKLRCILDRIYCLKPNELEAQTLTGESNPAKAAKELYALGVKRPFVSTAHDGIYSFNGFETVHIPSYPAKVIDATGAGDAAAAALVFAGINAMDLQESAVLAAKAGAKTVECRGANNPDLSEILS